jgi:Mg-chelatase subunit ChlD
MFRRSRILFALTVALGLTAPLLAQGGKPLAEDDLAKLIELKIDDAAVIAKIQKAGVAFRVDEEVLKRLKAAGASEALLEAIKESSAKKTSPAGKAITYQDVIQLLELKLDEDAILKRLAGTTFTLSAAQEAALKQAGASDRLVAAMKGGAAVADVVNKVTDLAVILDCSGSMAEKTKEGSTKMEVAKRVVTQLIDRIPAGLRVTFLVYGHDAKLECKAVKVVHELRELDADGKEQLKAFIAGLRPAGHTPIAFALKTAGKELAKQTDSHAGLVLITDGMETCHGDPAAEVAALSRGLNLDFGLHVVGFGVKANEQQAVQAIANASPRGKYYDAQSTEALQKAVGQLQEKVAEAAEAPKKRGGNRRAIVVLPPKIKLPPVKEIRLYKAGSYSPLVPSQGVEAVVKYGEEIRLPSADKYDLYWFPEKGMPVLILKGFSQEERRLREIRPEEYLGMVRVAGSGLPKAKEIFLAQNYDPISRHGLIQVVSGYNQDLVVPAGTYQLYIRRADNGDVQRLEEKLEVEAGKVTEVD